jgi:hypothetical protein
MLVKYGYTQNSVNAILINPVKHSFYLFAKNEKKNTALPDKKIIDLPSINSSNSFIAYLPIIKLKEMGTRKQVLFFSALSLNDILESSVNNINSGLLNTYDDQITELFKTAPSTVKLTCIISL